MNKNLTEIKKAIAHLEREDQKELMTYLLEKYTLNQTLAKNKLEVTTSYLKRLVRANRISEPIAKYTTPNNTEHFIFYTPDILDYHYYLSTYRALKEKLDRTKNI